MAERMHELPRTYRVVAAMRNSAMFYERFAHHATVDLNQREEARTDCRNHVQRRLREASRSPTESAFDVDGNAELICNAADGNFLIAEQSLASLAKQGVAECQPRVLTDLGQFFLEQFSRAFPNRSDYKPVRRMLSLLLAAACPLTIEDLAEYLGIDHADAEELIEPLLPFFPDMGHGHRPFHTAIRDWLVDSNNRRFRVAVKDGHQVLADSISHRLRSTELYGEQGEELIRHLMGAEEYQGVMRLMRDLCFVKEQIERGRVFWLIGKLDLLLRVTMLNAIDRQYIESLRRPLGRHAHFLARHPDTWFQCLTDLSYDSTTPGTLLEPDATRPSLPELCESWIRSSRPTGYWVRPISRDRPNQMKARLEGHHRVVTAIAVSPNQHCFCSASKDGSVRLWDSSTGDCLYANSQFGCAVTSVDFSPSGNWIAVSVMPNQVLLLDGQLRVQESQSWLADRFRKVGGVRFISDRSLIYFGEVIGDIDSELASLVVRDLKSGADSSFSDSRLGEVQTVAVDPRGEFLVCGDSQGEVCLWRVHDGQLLGSDHSQLGRIDAIAISPTRSWIATVSRDGTISLRDTQTGRERRKLAIPSVSAVEFLQDGRLLAVAINSGEILLYDVDSLEPISAWVGHQHWVRCLAVDHRQHLMLSGSADQTIGVWDTRQVAELSSVTLNSDRILSVAMSANGYSAASANQSGEVSLWDVSTGRVRWRSGVHGDEVMEMCFSQDGQYLVTGSADRSAACWDSNNGLVTKFDDQPGMVCCVNANVDASQIVAGDWEGNVHLYRRDYPSPARRWLVAPGKPVRSACVGDDQLVLAVSDDWTVAAWSAESGKEVFRREGWQKSTFLYVPNGRDSVFCGGSLTLQERASRALELRQTLSFGKEPTVACCDIDGRIHCVFRDGRIGVLGEGGTCRLTEGSISRIWGGDLIAAGERCIVSAVSSRGVEVFDWEGHRIHRANIPQGSYITVVACRADRYQFALGCSDGRILLYTVDSGHQNCRLLTESPSIPSTLAFSSDGKFLACGRCDGTVQLWEISNRGGRPTVSETGSRVTALCLSSDNQWVYTGHDDGTVVLHQLQGLTEVRRVIGHVDQVCSIVSLPEEPSFCSLGREGLIRKWDRRDLFPTQSVCDAEVQLEMAIRALLPETEPFQSHPSETAFRDEDGRLIGWVPYRIRLLAKDQGSRHWVGSDGRNVILFEVMAPEVTRSVNRTG